MEILNNSYSHNDTFLVTGATSPSGKHIVKALLEKKKTVRVIINNQHELEEMFTEEERLKIDRIIICDIINEQKGLVKNYTDTITDCLESKGDSKVSYVILAHALSYNDNLYASSAQKFYSFNKLLIDACVTYGNLKKILLLSPQVGNFSYLSWNYYKNIRKVQYYNKLTEDYIRKVGLNYLIVRPIDLTIAEKATSFSINQGEAMRGHINTATLGRIVVDTMLDNWIPSNVTYECVSSPDQYISPYNYVQGLYRLKQDIHRQPSLRGFNRKFYSRLLMIAGLSGFFFFLFSSGRIGLYLPAYLQNVFNYLKRYVICSNRK